MLHIRCTDPRAENITDANIVVLSAEFSVRPLPFNTAILSALQCAHSDPLTTGVPVRPYDTVLDARAASPCIAHVRVATRGRSPIHLLLQFVIPGTGALVFDTVEVPFAEFACGSGDIHFPCANVHLAPVRAAYEIPIQRAKLQHVIAGGRTGVTARVMRVPSLGAPPAQDAARHESSFTAVTPLCNGFHVARDVDESGADKTDCADLCHLFFAALEPLTMPTPGGPLRDSEHSALAQWWHATLPSLLIGVSDNHTVTKELVPWHAVANLRDGGSGLRTHTARTHMLYTAARWKTEKCAAQFVLVEAIDASRGDAPVLVACPRQNSNQRFMLLYSPGVWRWPIVWPRNVEGDLQRAIDPPDALGVWKCEHLQYLRPTADTRRNEDTFAAFAGAVSNAPMFVVDAATMRDMKQPTLITHTVVRRINGRECRLTARTVVPPPQAAPKRAHRAPVTVNAF